MNDTSQDKIVNEKPEIINNSLGLAFPAPALIGGYLFLALGIIGLINGYIIGLPVALVGGFVCFTVNGVLINVKDKTLRQYTSYYGMKSGKVKDLAQYPFICIFKSNKTHRMYSRSNRSVSYSETTFDIYLLNETHREKILIKVENGKDPAIKNAQQIAATLGILFVQYNPEVVSRKNRR